MKPTNSLTKTGTSPIETMKTLTSSPKMMQRFDDVLGKKAPQFLASIVSAYSSNKELQKADQMSVMAAGMIAATLNLDINPSLGFAAIIPYKKNKKLPDGSWSNTVEAQFQIMTKGFVQLSLRSGMYRNINVTEIYEDEFRSEDIITGEVFIEPVADGDRTHGRTSKIIGYVAYLEFVNGFRKMVYWRMDKILNHAKKFSKSFDSRSDKFYKGSAWDTNFEAMCRKTVLKNALSSWGILSTQMQEAVVVDGGIKPDMDADLEYAEDQPNIIQEPETVAEPEVAEQPKVETPEEPEDLGFGNDPGLDGLWGE